MVHRLSGNYGNGVTLFQLLPEDAHRRVNRSLHISITDVYTGQNKVISSYATRAELIDVRTLAFCLRGYAEGHS
jgi:hypothetical protein